MLARLPFQVQIRKVKKKKELRGNRNLSSSSPAFDRLDGIKKETGEEANESETEEEENGRGGCNAEAAAGSCCLVFLM